MFPCRPKFSGACRPLEYGGWLLLLIAAALLRGPHFRSLALQFDEVEYAYSVESDLLPHSPYILFIWMGRLLRPFVSLDLGYSLLSFGTSLGSILIFGLLIRRLTRSAIGGWTAGCVLALAPVSILFAGRQEVYPFQFLLLSVAWFAGASLHQTFLSGLFLGMALTAHTGTAFALPASLALLWPPCKEMEEEGRKHVRSLFLAGLLVPILVVLAWTVWIWVAVQGWNQLGLLLVYLQGNSPRADFSEVVRSVADNMGAVEKVSTLRENLGDQLERIWRDVGSGEVLTRGLAIFGVLGLALVPFKKAAPWWLLPLPYLVYEIGAGWTLDVGIYSVFLLPSLAAGIAYSAARLAEAAGWRFGTLIRGMTVAGGLAALLVNLPALHDLGIRKSLEPWLREEGSTMALAKWVKEQTPPETLVLVPVDWHYCGLAIPYYSGRIPVFSDAYVLTPTPWKPIYAHRDFNYLTKVTDEDLDRWLDEERPILCFDPHPFSSFGADWSGVDTDRLEARPLVWLDRNQSGTSLSWRNPEVLFHYRPQTSNDPDDYKYYAPHSLPLPAYELELFRPTLYRIARKSDPESPPDWARNLQSKVPQSQWGAPPSFQSDGIVFTDEFRFQSPAKPGRDHMVRLVLHSKGQDYAVRCEIKLEGGWNLVGRDMEKYVMEPPTVFCEMYFQIPGEWIDEENLKLTLSPDLGTRFANLYEVTVAVIED